jgi:hypothetical protein
MQKGRPKPPSILAAPRLLELFVDCMIALVTGKLRKRPQARRPRPNQRTVRLCANWRTRIAMVPCDIGQACHNARAPVPYGKSSPRVGGNPISATVQIEDGRLLRGDIALITWNLASDLMVSR